MFRPCPQYLIQKQKVLLFVFGLDAQGFNVHAHTGGVEVEVSSSSLAGDVELTSHLRPSITGNLLIRTTKVFVRVQLGHKPLHTQRLMEASGKVYAAARRRQSVPCTVRRKGCRNDGTWRAGIRIMYACVRFPLV